MIKFYQLYALATVWLYACIINTTLNWVSTGSLLHILLMAITITHWIAVLVVAFQIFWNKAHEV